MVICDLLNRKYVAYGKLQQNPRSIKLKEKFQELKRQTQRELHWLRDKWWDDRAKYLQELADNNDKRFYVYSELKTIIDPTPTNISPLRNEDDQLLTGKTEILDRWKDILTCYSTEILRLLLQH